MKTKLIPFDLETYNTMEPKPQCFQGNSERQPLRILRTDGPGQYPVIAVDSGGYLMTFMGDGRECDETTAPAIDLHMLVPVKEPRVIPWTFDTCPLGEVVKSRLIGGLHMITGKNVTHAFIGFSFEYKVLLESFDLVTPEGLKPCGTEVEG